MEAEKEVLDDHVWSNADGWGDVDVGVSALHRLKPGHAPPALILTTSSSRPRSLLAWEEVYELDILQDNSKRTIQVPCVIPANDTIRSHPSSEGVGEDNPKNTPRGFGDVFRPTYFKGEGQDTEEALGMQDEARKICLVQSVEDAMQYARTASSIASIVQLMLQKDLYSEIDFIVADTHCPEDGNEGPRSSW